MPGFSQLQDRVLQIAKFLRPPLYLASAAVAALAMLLGAACAAEEEMPGFDPSGEELALVWEAMDTVSANYSAPVPVDREAMAGGAIGRIMEMGEIEPYPFLADLGRMRGQMPPSVPEGMNDLWWASRIYLEENPDVEPDELAPILVRGMIDALPGLSSAYFTAEQLPEARERMERDVEGSYLGIGASVVAQEGRILLFPFTDSPAEKAGVEQGDSLLAVNGVPVSGDTPAEVGEQVRGPEGTKVLLRLERAGEPEPLELEVFRGNIQLDTVGSQLVRGGIGYVRIQKFRDNTGEQVFEALEQLKQFDMLALILDLRRNPGGSGDAAAEVAAQILPPGSTFRFVEEGEGERREHLIPEFEGRLSLEELPVAVLVDELTIGEAEALAAVLQEAERAVIVGVPTFGDGSDYSFVELTDGSALFLPTSSWYTPSGSWVGESPVQPDHYVEYEEVPTGVGGELQFNTAYELLDAQLPLFR